MMKFKNYLYMNVEEALLILDIVLQKKFLNNVQELVFRQAWAGKTYAEMAESSGYDANYIKDIGYKLWKLLSKAFNEEVTKSNFRAVLRRQYVAFEYAWRLSNFSEGESPSSYTEDSVFFSLILAKCLERRQLVQRT